MPVEQLRAYETGLYQFLDTRRPQVLTALAEKKQIDDDVKAALKEALTEFGKQFAAGREAGRGGLAIDACPHLLDIRRRIRAVKSTQQITKAMKMVAASKLRRAQERDPARAAVRARRCCAC